MKSTRLALMLWLWAITSAAYGQGQVLNRTLQHDGLTRSYSIYVPHAYTGEAAWPLVLNMHFMGGNAAAQMAQSGMNGLADAGNFLVAYPNATVNPQIALSQWNEGTLYRNGPDDVGFINAMLDELEIGYHINSSRIYASGISSGGMMSYHLGSELSGRIAAIASVAGQHPANPTAPRPLPVLHFHGTADPVLPFNGGIGNLPPPLNTFQFPAVADVIDAWRDSNNSVGDPITTQLPNLNTRDGSTVTMIQYIDGDHYETYSGDRRPAEVLFYRIEGGGHTWPSGMNHPAFLGNVNRDINATEEIWNFFSRHELAAGPVSTWGTDADGIWSQAANWNNGIVRNAVDAEALFRAVITQPRTVSADMPITVGRIDFESSQSYTIAGPNSITFDVAEGSANINVHSGSHTISAPVILTDNAVISVWPLASNLSITRGLNAANVSLVKAGAGTLTVNELRAAGLTINGGAVVIAPNGGDAGTSVVDVLDVSGTSRLDLNNNDLVVRATAATKDAVHDAIQDDIASAQNGLDAALITKWDGPGITSSTACTFNVAQGFDLTGIGVIRNSDLDITTGIPGSSYTSFSGQAVTPDDVLVKYTYIGDANLNGVVSFDDYVGMDNAFFELIPNLGWATGDINFDGLINFDDYSKVDQAFFFQAAPLGSGDTVAAVPEPAAGSILLVSALVVFFSWRRRTSLRLRQ